MTLVRVDEKGRIVLPREVRKAWRLKPKQPLIVKRRGKELVISKVDEIMPQMTRC